MAEYERWAAAAIVVSQAEAAVAPPESAAAAAVNAVGGQLALLAVGLPAPDMAEAPEMADAWARQALATGSGDVLRRLRVLSVAVTALYRTLGQGAAEHWLNEPDPGLGGFRPAVVLASPAGGVDGEAAVEAAVLRSAGAFLADALSQGWS